MWKEVNARGRYRHYDGRGKTRDDGTTAYHAPRAHLSPYSQRLCSELHLTVSTSEVRWYTPRVTAIHVSVHEPNSRSARRSRHSPGSCPWLGDRSIYGSTASDPRVRSANEGGNPLRAVVDRAPIFVEDGVVTPPRVKRVPAGGGHSH